MANLFDEIDKELAARRGSKNGDKIYRPNGKVDWYAMATGSGADKVVEEPNDTVGNGFIGHVVDSAQAGAAGSLGGFARFLEEFSPVGNEWLGDFANGMNKIVKRNTPLQPLEGTDWVAGALGNAIGSGIPSIVAGAAIIGAAGAIGAAVPASVAAGVIRARTALPAIDKIVRATKEMWSSPFGKLALTETAGSAFEGTTEAGNLISEMRDKGYTDEEIRQAAIASATMNTGWLMVANAIGGALTAKYGKEAVKGGLKQMAANAGKGAVVEGSSEAVQEYGQSLIGNVAEGTELDHEAASEAAAQAFVGSGILGGFGGVAAPYINNKANASETQPTTESEQEKVDDDGTEATSTETNTTVTPEVKQARNEIIGYRETFNEDDVEFGRLTELLEKGSDEEIIAEAEAIRTGKPVEQEVQEPELEAEKVLQEDLVEQPETEEPVGDAAETVELEQPEVKDEVGGKQDGNTLSPQGEIVKDSQNTSDNGKPQENGVTPPEDKQDSKSETNQTEVEDKDLPPSLDETMEGLLTEKPKSRIRKAQEQIKNIKDQERQERLDDVNQETTVVKDDTETNEYGYKKKLGEYEINPAAEKSEKYHGYSRSDGSDYKAIHKNDNDTYMVETVISDDDGNESSTYETFENLKDAEDFIVSGKRSKPTKLKTFWASVRDSKNKIKILKMAYNSKEHFKNDLRGNGYRVRVVATPDKFDQEVEKFNNRVEAYNQRRKESKAKANQSLKGDFTVIDGVDETSTPPLSDSERKSRVRILDNLVAMLRKTGVSVYTDAQSLAKAVQGGHNGTDGKIVVENNKVYIEDKNGKRFKVNGLADKTKGIIYLNRADVRLDVPVHEYTHIWSQILRASKPELWNKGVELLKQTAKWNEIKNHEGYKLASDNAIADEVLSWLAGENSAKVFEKLEGSQDGKTLVSKLKAWLKEFWSELKSFFERNGNEGVDELTLEEFVNMPLKDLIKGTKFKEIKDRAQITATDNSVFAKYDPNRNISGIERKLEAFLRNANTTTKKAFASSKVKAQIIGIAEKKPELLVWDNKENGEHYYYAKYLAKPKSKEPVTKQISASEFRALRAITGAEAKPYKVKSEAVKEGLTPQESILADTDIKETVKQMASNKKKYIGKEEQIETLLGMTDEASGKTVAEQVRDAAAKDLPESGKENDEDAFMDLDFEWTDNDYADEWAYEYYNYLINKYQTKSGDLSAMLVPVAKEQNRNKKIRELEKRLDSGESRLSIWKETGWYKSKDGHWKYFIDDDLNKIDLGKISTEDGDIPNNTEVTAGVLYDNPELFRKFPYLADVKVKFVRLLGSNGMLKDGVINIKANRSISAESIKRTLIHELQHIIQEKEGMAVGTSPKDIKTSYNDTVDAYWNEAGKIGRKAQKCLTKYSEWIYDSINPFDETVSRADKKGSKEDYLQAKDEFEKTASPESRKRLRELLKKVKTLAEKTKESLKNKSKGDNGFNQAYLDALGEEEARLVQYKANPYLSDKDQEIKTGLESMLEEMVDEEAELATSYLYGTGRAIAGDVKITDSEKQELEAFGEELSMFGWSSFVDLLNSADDKKAVADSLSHLHFIMGHDDRSIVFLGEPQNALSLDIATNSNDTLLSRGMKAVVTKKPKSVVDDIKENGYKGWAKQMFRKFYRNMVDKNIDLKDFDNILSNVLGRTLSVGESIYEKAQMVSSNAAGLTTALINGDGKHISAINSKLERKKMKYKVTLSTVLNEVNDKAMKPYEDYLKASGCDNWIEAFGAYLGWRRLSEMARLHREAFAQEHAEWAARKRAYDEWVAGGRLGKNPQVAAYEAWEVYQKNLKNAQKRWERAGKIGTNPADAIRAEYLKTHKSEEQPSRVVGKEPVFTPYKTPKEAGNLTEQELNQLIKNAPEPFAKAAKMYYMLNDNILSIMEDASLIDAKTHELLNEKYKDYCPMIRDFSDTAAVEAFVESITAGGNGVANVSSMLKKIRAEGSERTIINPLESTIQTIAAVSNRAERNKAGQHLVMMMTKAEDLKGYIRKLEQPKHGAIQADPKNCIFTVMFNGKKVAYQSDPEYYQAIVGYNLPTSSLLLRVPETAAKCLRTGATMSPSFIVRNVFRDTITAGIASKNGFIPIIDTIRGAKALWNDQEFRANFEASGVVSFNQFGSAESAYNNLTDLSSGKNYTVYEPKEIFKGVLQAVMKGHGLEALKTAGISFEQLSSFMESATRAGEFKKALESGKSIDEAAYDAKEVTLNFSRSGIVGQRWNQVVPFFNACIQGGDKMIRLFYENPKATALKVAQYIVLPSLALWALNHDEDWYEELDPQVKYSHWCLPNGIRVPKPQEYGILFGGSIEAMLDAAALKDPKAMSEWAKGVRDVLTPNILPTIILPLLEWQTNYSFFKGRDLVPQRLQRMPDELQYSTGTSELSKFVGKHTYVSPIKVDNLVRGYTGTMGTFLWQTPDWFAAEKQNLPAKELNEMQFIRDFNVTDANRTRYLNDFYELQDKANKQQAGYGLKGKPSSAVKAIRKAGKTINDLNKQIRVIETSANYTPERKRELIDKKRERINATAKAVVKKYGEQF